MGEIQKVYAEVCHETEKEWIPTEHAAPSYQIRPGEVEEDVQGGG